MARKIIVRWRKAVELEVTTEAGTLTGGKNERILQR